MLDEAWVKSMDTNFQDGDFENAELGIKWIEAYTGKDIRYCDESDRNRALRALPVLVGTMGYDETGNPLDDQQREARLGLAREALQWIETYTSKAIRHCDESDRNRALRALPMLVSTMGYDENGNALNDSEVARRVELSKFALEWIEQYTGKGLYHCSEKDKALALAAYREASISKPEQDGQLKELQESADQLRLQIETLQTELENKNRKHTQELEDEKRKHTQELEDERRKHTQELSEYAKRIRDYEDQISKRQTDNDNLATLVNELKEELASAKKSEPAETQEAEMFYDTPSLNQEGHSQESQSNTTSNKTEKKSTESQFWF